MQIPVACSLGVDGAKAQAAEWHALLAKASTGIGRTSTGELAVRLVDDAELVSEVVALARREKACCPFFDFTLRIECDALTLLVGVPAEAASVLDDLDPSSAR